jgi:hypothetical protein
MRKIVYSVWGGSIAVVASFVGYFTGDVAFILTVCFIYMLMSAGILFGN